MATVIGSIALVLVALALAWLTWTFNRLVGLRNRLKAAWGDVDALLKRRADLIPNLVEAVKGYMDHESRTLSRVTTARSNALMAGGAPDNTSARAHAENQLTSGVRQLFAVVENYPDLKASENFLQLQAQLAETENDIASGRRYYNAVVRDFNTLRETFPNLLIAGPLGFHAGEYFELADLAEREAPSADVRESG
ncbi:MAG TPA: LemA family protein [Gemmatimonadota bacterium]|nr:LemA family protein [Gemmatimonadota bacterium]